MVGLAAPGLAGWVCIATATTLPPLYAGRKGIQSKNIHGRNENIPALLGFIH
jgi:hypothetical protein